MAESARRCIVTGGTGHIGQAICRALASQGARVGLTYHRAGEAARALCKELDDAVTSQLDLTETDQIGPTLSALADRLGGVDAFIHAAGLTSTCDPPIFDKLEDMASPGWDRLMAVNAKGPAFACRALAPRLAEQGGNIVFVGAINGVKPVPSPVAYAGSKAALHGMAQALAKELGPSRVLVNVVAPGALDGGTTARSLPEELKREYVKHNALKRFGTAEEIANIVTFLALDNTYVTGRTILVDGGL